MHFNIKNTQTIEFGSRDQASRSELNRDHSRFWPFGLTVSPTDAPEIALSLASAPSVSVGAALWKPKADLSGRRPHGTLAAVKQPVSSAFGVMEHKEVPLLNRYSPPISLQPLTIVPIHFAYTPGPK